MKVFCNVSGVTYTTNIGLGNFTAVHPTLSLPISELRKIGADQLTYRLKNKDSVQWKANTYLYLLSWFMKLPNIEVRNTIDFNDCFHILVANQEQLIRTVLEVDKFKHKVSFPAIVVSKDSPLSLLKGWLETYEELIELSRVRAAESNRQRTARELDEKLDSITDIFVQDKVKNNASLIADWANVSSKFPSGVSVLWKDIIIAILRNNAKKLLSLDVTLADIDEIIEHCEDNIPHGSYHANILMTSLRSAEGLMNTLPEYRAKHITTLTYATDSDEEEPIEDDFESRAEYLKAKANYLASKVKIQSRTASGKVTIMEF